MNWFNKLFPGFRRKSGTFGIVSSSWGRILGMTQADSLKSPTIGAVQGFVSACALEPAMIFETLKAGGDWDQSEPVRHSWLTADLVEMHDGVLTVQQTHSGRISAAAADLAIYGNAFFIVARNQADNPVALEYVPWGMVLPEIRGSNIITGYRVQGRSEKLRAGEVIHVRMGIDPTTPCLGKSMEAYLKEPAAADVEIARYTARITKSPSPSHFIKAPGCETEDQINQVRIGIEQATTGEHAGGVIVNADPDFSVTPSGYSPENMALDQLAVLPQFAIAGIVQIPVQALAVYAASRTSTYANYQEAIKAAWSNAVKPILKTLAEALTKAMDDPKWRVRFRFEDVLALQEDEGKKADRAKALYSSGVVDRATAKEMVNVDQLPTDIEHYAADDRMPNPLSSTDAQSVRSQVGA